MSSPVSSGLFCDLVSGEESLQGAVLVGVVGGVVLPAVPDDVEPGAGEDADGVGVVVSAVDRSLVEVLGPEVGAAAVAGEVADGVAQLLVAGPAEADGAALAGLAGAGSDAGQAGEGCGGGEASPAVPDFGEQPGGAHGARAREAGEEVLVGVRGELLADLLLECGDLLTQSAQGRDVGQCDVAAGLSFASAGPRGAASRRACSVSGLVRPEYRTARSQCAKRLGLSQSARP